MNRRKIEKEKAEKLARISSGFGKGMSYTDGIIMGANSIDSGCQGSAGILIPWMGCKHIKILIGDPS